MKNIDANMNLIHEFIEIQNPLLSKVTLKNSFDVSGLE